ncbi:MAG TPA: nitrite/sulfite reductase [Polyangiaceae bacterium]
MSTTAARPNPGIANEVLKLHADAVRFLAGELAPAKFRGQRVLHGIYEQRRRGSFMLRVRFAAGLVGLQQLHGLAQLALDHGVARLHVTTRQDIQLHDLRLETALELQPGLLGLSLTGYGSGGNTVRNVAAEPLSGLLRDEAFDVRPYALAVARRYLGPDKHPSLPRKFKIAFSGSDADRAGATAADLGFVAKRRGEELGFQVFVAGGLGLRPALGLELFSWIDASETGRIAQGVLNVFAQHGDRVHRHKARLRHLRARLGDAELLRLCHERIGGIEASPSRAAESEPVSVAGELPTLASPLPEPLRRLSGIVQEREPGRFSVRLVPSHGDLTPVALLALAEAGAEFCAPTVRVGLDQELWLTGIGGNAVESLLARLRGQELGAPDECGQTLVACSGASTCQLGLLRSRDAADAIARRLSLSGVAWNGEPVRISGCPNACARHLLTQLGFEGRTKRVEARLLPSYAVFFGGTPCANNPRLGVNIGVIPAKRVPEFVLAMNGLNQDIGGPRQEHLNLARSVLEPFTRLPNPVPEDWFLDWGCSTSLDPAEGAS